MKRTSILILAVISIIGTKSYSQLNIVDYGNFEEAIDTTSNIAITPTTSRHSVNLELGGGSILFSPGYEYSFLKKQHTRWSARIGIEYFPFDYSYGIPLHLNCIMGNKKINFFSNVGTVVILQRPEPWDRELRKKIRRGDLSSADNFTGTYAGIDYIPTIQLPPNIGIGMQINTKNMYVRLTANGLLLYRFDTVRFKYFFDPFPWGGLTIGYQFKNKAK